MAITHVLICGGGAGSAIMHLLVKHGYTVSAGVLNEGDMDWETARAAALYFVSRWAGRRLPGTLCRVKENFRYRITAAARRTCYAG